MLCFIIQLNLKESIINIDVKPIIRAGSDYLDRVKGAWANRVKDKLC